MAALLIASSVRGQTPTPFPMFTPNPTPTPGAGTIGNWPFLDRNFRGPRLVLPTEPTRVLHLSSGKFLIYYAPETLVNREAGCLQRYNADGSYDASFKFVSADRVYAVTEAGDQLLVGVVPNANSPVLANAVMQLMRVNDDGSLDPTFSANAVADYYFFAISVQPDGKILVSGDFYYFANQTHYYLVRLLPSGEVDPSFASPSLSGGSLGHMGHALQSDGRIIITGTFSKVNGISRPRVARLNADGSLDTSFVPSGFTNNSLIRNAVPLPDGKVIIAGGFTVPASYQSNPTGASFSYLPLLRLTSTGAADGTFGCFDQSLFGQGTGFYASNGVARQEDGKLIALATYSTGINALRSVVYRFDADGVLDPSFHRPSLKTFAAGSSDFLPANLLPSH